MKGMSSFVTAPQPIVGRFIIFVWLLAKRLMDAQLGHPVHMHIQVFHKLSTPSSVFLYTVVCQVENRPLAHMYTIQYV